MTSDVNWEERIGQLTHAELRREHAARYAWAEPVVAAANLWCDLGCGEGVGARDGLGAATRPCRALLVDREPDIVAAAQASFPGAEGLVADLATADGVGRLSEALGADGGTITCFEVIEHLEDFEPLLGLLKEAGESRGFTVLVSVPNDEFSGIENPHHRTVWGTASFDELRRLLPSGHLAARQLELAGTAITLDKGTAWSAGSVEDVDQPPTHFLAAFGPLADRVGPVDAAGPVNRLRRRAWERQRESDMEYLRRSEAVAAELRTELKAANDAVAAASGTIADYLRYIAELEERIAAREAEAPSPDPR